MTEDKNLNSLSLLYYLIRKKNWFISDKNIDWFLSIAIILRSDKFMNAVGIDVSKGKSMVAIMRPFGEIVSTPLSLIHI